MNGIIEGTGTYKWRAGREWRGKYANYRREGKGKYIWHSGEHYEFNKLKYHK